MFSTIRKHIFLVGIIGALLSPLMAQKKQIEWNEQFIQSHLLNIIDGQQPTTAGYYLPDITYANDLQRNHSLLNYLLKHPHLPIHSGSSFPATLPLLLQMPLVNTPVKIEPIRKTEEPLFSTLTSSPVCLLSFPQHVDHFPATLSSIESHPVALNIAFVTNVQQQLQKRNIALFRRTASDLLEHRINGQTIGNKEVKINVLPSTKALENSARAEDGFKQIIPERKYWYPGFESRIHITQNYISPNWHKGGKSNLNLSSKQLLKLDHKTDNSLWANQLDWRLSLYSATNQEKFAYQISEDLLRLNSNFGYKAYKKWFYTVDFETRTQLFANYSENKTQLYSDFLSPLSATLGIGMKYELDWKSEKVYGRRFRLNVNISPIAYDFKWSKRTDIDLGRHGLKPDKRIYSAIGSMLRADMIWNINPTFAWESRLYYNTSYKRIEAETENSLIFTFNQYLSTRLNLTLRYDDAVPILPGMKNRLQMYQLLSFGIDWTL